MHSKNKSTRNLLVKRFDLRSRQASDSSSNLQLPAHHEFEASFVLGQSLQLGDRMPWPHETCTESFEIAKKCNALSSDNLSLMITI